MDSFSASLCFFSLPARFSGKAAEVKEGVNKSDPNSKILPFCKADWVWITKLRIYLICELTWKEKSFKPCTHLCALFSKISENFVLKKIKNYWQVFVPVSAVTAEWPSSPVQMQLISYIYNYCSCVCTVTIGEHHLLHTCCLPIFKCLQTPVPPASPSVTY